MGYLKLYAPDEVEPAVEEVVTDSEPAILSFVDWTSRMPRRRFTDPAARARLVCKNRCCRFCHHTGVELIELQDAVLNSRLQPVPATATLVGFHCSTCQREWPA